MRGPAYLWWSLPRIKSLLFPDVTHHNWAGKSKDRWFHLLEHKFGLSAGDLRVSERSAANLKKRGREAEVEDPNFDFSFSTAGLMGMFL